MIAANTHITISSTDEQMKKVIMKKGKPSKRYLKGKLQM